MCRPSNLFSRVTPQKPARPNQQQELQLKAPPPSPRDAANPTTTFDNEESNQQLTEALTITLV